MIADHRAVTTGDHMNVHRLSQRSPYPLGIIGKFRVGTRSFEEDDLARIISRHVSRERKAAGFAHPKQRRRQIWILVEQPVPEPHARIPATGSAEPRKQGWNRFAERRARVALREMQSVPCTHFEP